MKSLLIIPGRFYRFSMMMAVSAYGSPYSSSFKAFPPFQQIKPTFSPCGYSAAEGYRNNKNNGVVAGLFLRQPLVSVNVLKSTVFC